jgi:RimJ/RimL family protein N-acetyltransferase
MAITLRPVADADLDPVFTWQADPRATRMAVFTPEDPADRAAFDAHQARIRSDPTVLMRAVLDDGALAGTIATFDQDGEREVTYWIDPSRWGRGIATEALGLLLALEPVRPVRGRVAASNVASRRVLEKVGFRVVGAAPEVVSWRGTEVAELTLRLD